jgi:hypothetical protein
VLAGRPLRSGLPGELCLCQTTSGAFGTAPFLKGELGQPDFFFFGGGVTSSDWLVSDLSEPADLKSIENLAVPVVINFCQQTATFQTQPREGVL